MECKDQATCKQPVQTDNRLATFIHPLYVLICMSIVTIFIIIKIINIITIIIVIIAVKTVIVSTIVIVIVVIVIACGALEIRMFNVYTKRR